jgi:hypothetical protein
MDHDRDPFIHLVHGNFGDPLALLEAEGGELARAAAGDDAVDAAGQLKVYKSSERVLLDALIGWRKGGTDGGENTMILAH